VKTTVPLAEHPGGGPGTAVRRWAVIPAAAAGRRFDQQVAALFPEFSRNQLQHWIRQGALRLGGRQVKPGQRVAGGERVELSATIEAHDEHRAEAIPLEILYQDESLLVIAKPPGLVVHPAAGNWTGTLQNALLHYDPNLAALPRAGLIHRLDKETSGALLVARTTAVRVSLVAALKERRIERRYDVLVWGRLPAPLTVDVPLGRDPRRRTRMAATPAGKPARTHFSLRQQWRHAAWLEARLETGRTHQIRVHAAHAGLPVIGDPLYGRRKPPAALTAPLAAHVASFKRQALHAREIRFTHPVSGIPLTFKAQRPADLEALIAVFREQDGMHGAGTSGAAAC